MDVPKIIINEPHEQNSVSKIEIAKDNIQFENRALEAVN